MVDIAEVLRAGLAHQQAGRVAAAASAYRRVLAELPDQPNALALYGHLLAPENPAEAEKYLTRVAALRPDDAEARLALGNLAQRGGHPDRAARWWRDALAVRPGHVGATVNLAGHCRARGDFASGIAVCRAALAHAPEVAVLWLALAETLLADAQFPAALSAADAALARGLASAPVLLVRGTAQAALGPPGAAEPWLRAACRLAPADARAALHLGNVLIDLDRWDEAAIWLDLAIERDPELPEALTSRGVLFARCGALATAQTYHRRALAQRPNFAEAWSNLAAALLLAGDYPAGFAAYEWRKRNPRFGHGYWRGTAPEWRGEPLEGRRLLVFCEQGLGDALMMARYFPRLVAAGARLVLVCAAPLVPLFQGLEGVTQIVRRGPYPSPHLVAAGETIPDHDFYIDSLSLPRVFGATRDTVAVPAPYLRPSPERLAAWRHRLKPGVRLGVVWAGNPAHSDDRSRSLPVEVLAPLKDLPGCQGVALQPHGEVPDWLLNVQADLTDMAETAALVSTLDAVITVDTAVGHLAGALCVPTALLLPFAPDWRWALGRNDTPWYAGHRLFRQNRRGDWHEPVAAALAWLQHRGCRSTPEP